MRSETFPSRQPTDGPWRTLLQRLPGPATPGPTMSAPGQAFFFIFILKKFQKYMSVLRNFKNGPLSPMGATGLFYNFFYKLVLGQRGAGARRGGRPPNGRQGPPSLYKASTLILSSFEPKNSTKNPEKKRGVRRREAAKPCRIVHL